MDNIWRMAEQLEEALKSVDAWLNPIVGVGNAGELFYDLVMADEPAARQVIQYTLKEFEIKDYILIPRPEV